MGGVDKEAADGAPWVLPVVNVGERQVGDIDILFGAGADQGVKDKLAGGDDGYQVCMSQNRALEEGRKRDRQEAGTWGE